MTTPPPATSNGRSDEGNRSMPFPIYFQSWINDQRYHLQELVAVSKQHQEQLRNPASNVHAQIVDDVSLLRLIERLTLDFELYSRTKSAWATNHVTSMFAPSWLSSLEKSYIWVGGWRPALAIEVLYYKSAIQMEARVDEVLMGLSTGDLADLSESQRLRLESTQRGVFREETGIMDELNSIHISLGNASTVELVHNVSEMMREGVAVDQRLVNAHLSLKEARQLRVLQMADDLRMRTLKKVIDILSPIQSVHFLIALMELQLRIHEWGQSRDSINDVGGRAQEA